MINEEWGNQVKMVMNPKTDRKIADRSKGNYPKQRILPNG